MTDASQRPPGWYDDGEGAIRWWSGRDWTEHVQGPAAEAESSMLAPAELIPPAAASLAEKPEADSSAKAAAPEVQPVAAAGPGQADPLAAPPVPDPLPPGFYDDGHGVRRWWDGQQWTPHAEPGTQAVLCQFASHIEGRNARVYVYENRIEWERPRTLLKGKASTDMIPVKNISSVTSKRDGIFNTWVHILAAGGRLSFRVSHREAGYVLEVLNGLVLGTSQQLAERLAQERQPARNEFVAAPAKSADLSAEVAKLAAFRDQGILTEEEFGAAKRRLLGL